MICGDDPFCRFDVAATSRTDIGLNTLQGNIEFETIVNISQPGTFMIIMVYVMSKGYFIIQIIINSSN